MQKFMKFGLAVGLFSLVLAGTAMAYNDFGNHEESKPASSEDSSARNPAAVGHEVTEDGDMPKPNSHISDDRPVGAHSR